MSEKLNVLSVEDSTNDALLIERALRTDGFDVAFRRVETEEEYRGALLAGVPDVILADYRLPAFSGRAALAIAREQAPHTPVIMVTGTILDHDAVALLREGAVDYVLKDRLSRLGPAVRRALGDARAAAEREAMQEKYRALFDESADGIALVDRANDAIVECNAEFARQCGRTPAELAGTGIWDVQARNDANTESSAADVTFLSKPDGTKTPVELRAKGVTVQGRRWLQVICRDITQRMAAEERLQEQLAELRRFQRVTVDRELRMEVLEKEIATLRRAAAAATA